MSAHRSILVSLEDAVATCCSLVSNYALERFSRFNDLSPRQQSKISAPNADLLRYNYGPFMHALIGDIFSNDLKLGDHPASTKVLMQDGIDEAAAVQITTQVFQLVADSIGLSAPGISFGNPRGFDAALCNDFDLMITVFPLEEQGNHA